MPNKIFMYQLCMYSGSSKTAKNKNINVGIEQCRTIVASNTNMVSVRLSKTVIYHSLINVSYFLCTYRKLNQAFRINSVSKLS